MYATARGVLRTASIKSTKDPCRIIGGARHPPLYRSRAFHHSTKLHSLPDDEKLPKDDKGSESTPVELETDIEEQDAKIEEAKGEEEVRESLNASGAPPDLSALSQRVRAARNARAARANRQKQPEGLPPVRLPEWFWTQCLNPEPATVRTYTPKSDVEVPEEEEDDGVYSISRPVYDEISGAIKAALKLRPPKNHEHISPIRPSIVLQCPKEGGITFLDSVVGQIAAQNKAHLIRINAHDIANIAGTYIDENLAWNHPTVSLFGYETQEQAGKLENYEHTSKSDAAEDEADDSEEPLPASILNLTIDPAAAAKRMASIARAMASNQGQRGFGKGGSQSRFNPGALQAVPFGKVENLGSMSEPPSSFSNSQRPWNDLKLTTALEAMVNSANTAHAYDLKETSLEPQTSVEPADEVHSQPPDYSQLVWPKNEDERQMIMEKRHKRAKALSQASSAEKAESQTAEQPTSTYIDVIVQVADYKELSAVTGGSQLLSRLQSIVNRQWLDGRNIVLVGTTSSSDPDGPILEKSEIQLLQEDVSEGSTRTIYVPPEQSESQHERFVADEKIRIRSINIRHVGEMIEKLSEGSEQIQPDMGDRVSNALRELDRAVVFTSGIEDAVWTYARVYRFANIILGSMSSMDGENDATSIQCILELLSSSDDAKFQWGADEIKKIASESAQPKKVVLNAEDAAKKHARMKIDAIRKTCNNYERSLLHGVVFPSNIRTTFDDIRAPKTTIEALKSLTSLSLLRPDAFSYGVLATEKISGLLLYGPPGTGKTLLAKAVAKESGATVLEVTSAELNAMFVGESEKNVRAVFSLARKLSPCVVFIDEVDSIFASREHSRNRTGSRALLNQFLRELDGMNDLSTFIMVATNRPFDLDDAVLRRLPRRLLVDLPTQKDREEILRIHLKSEELSPDVSLEKLAKDTPFYSGSDLKHVVVTAAINATLEENKLAALHTGDEPHKYPETRILTQAHFTKALEEISASISEDMGSLTAIKKFDEKYGDRKGRRKKGPGMGFGGTKTIEKDSESARVRKSVPIVEEPET